MSKFRFGLLQNEEGQAVILVSLFLSFVFLALAALAIDGTIVYLRRRQLQNIADAAALTAAIELGQLGTETEAYQAAMGNIAANEGQIEWYSTSGTPNPPATNVGAGLDLTQGIEISAGCDVRVALRWSDIGTYFAQFVGRDLLQVSANAHAGCNRGGGLQPIAMKRFGDELDTTVGVNPNQIINNSSRVYCDECDTRRSLQELPPNEQGHSNAFDFFLQEGSDQISNWPDWPDGAGLYRTPVTHATTITPGREFFFLGVETSPNQGNNAWAGLIDLDIRRVDGDPGVDYFNGVTAGTNANTLKDMAEYYIRAGYCCDDLPKPGDWVAMFSGANTSFAPAALQDIYPPGSVIAILIYNGTVFETPRMVMTGDTPNFQVTYPATNTVTSEVLTYTISLSTIDNFQSSSQGLSMNVEGLEGFANWRFSNASPIMGHGGVTHRDVTLFITPTLTGTIPTQRVVTGTRMFYVSAIDDKFGGTGVRNYWAGIASVGETVQVGASTYQYELPAVTGTPTNLEDNYPFLIVAKGYQANYGVELNLWGGAGNQDVQVTYVGPDLSTYGLSWGGGSTGTWSANNVRANPPPQAAVNIKIDVEDTAVANTTYTLPFLVTAEDGMTASFNLYIYVEETQSNPNNWVEILGYAAVEIEGYYNNQNRCNPICAGNANTVRGKFVSALMGHPSELTYGLRARLIPWDQ